MNFEEAISFDNLYKGLQDSCRNVRWKDTVVRYEAGALRNTYLLRQDLLHGKYELQSYQRFKVYEPKVRDIVATRIRDRQLQHSITDNILYDQITKSFIRDNCACLRGRGVDDCLDRLTAHLRRFHLKHGCDGWALKCDIRHYFQSIPHDVAKKAVAKRVKDEKVVEEVYRIIDSFGGGVGIGLGSQISQLVALAVLDDLDHFIKERLHIKYYVRYMDDFVLIHEDKEYLKYCLEQIKLKLAEIGLGLNDKTAIFPLKHGIKMLKWRFILCESGKILRRMDRKKFTKQCKKISKLYAMECDGIMKPGTCNQSMQAWMANAKRGDTFYVRKSLAEFYYNLTGGTKYHEYVKLRAKNITTGINRSEKSDRCREQRGEHRLPCNDDRL